MSDARVHEEERYVVMYDFIDSHGKSSDWMGGVGKMVRGVLIVVLWLNRLDRAA